MCVCCEWEILCGCCWGPEKYTGVTAVNYQVCHYSEIPRHMFIFWKFCGLIFYLSLVPVGERYHFFIPTCELICLLSVNHQTSREKSPVWETLCHLLSVLSRKSKKTPAEVVG